MGNVLVEPTTEIEETPPALEKPDDVDPNWADKLQRAHEARRLGQALRHGRQAGFATAHYPG